MYIYKMRALGIAVTFMAFIGCATTGREIVAKGNTTKTPENIGNLDSALDNLTTQIVKSMVKGEKKKVAVVEFSDLEGKATGFSKYLAEELITRLFTTRKFEVIERRLLNKVLSELKLSLTGIIEPSSAKELGQILGIDAIVSGTITDLGTSLKVNARIISTSTGKVFAVAATEIVKDVTVRKLMSQVIVVQKPEKKTVEKPIERLREGLKAEYFNLPPFTDNPGALPDEPTFTRIDNAIDFNWGGASPAPNISADYFGVRWSGMIHVPITGTYHFAMWHDDGVRLVINDQLLIDYWGCPYWNSEFWHASDVFLKGDKWYPIEVQLFEKVGGAGARLYWVKPGSDKQTVVLSSNFRTKISK